MQQQNSKMSHHQSEIEGMKKNISDKLNENIKIIDEMQIIKTQGENKNIELY